MKKSVDLSSIYKLRNGFIIIGLTGRTGAGCTEVAKQLKEGFGDISKFPAPQEFDLKDNTYRKYRIIYDYAKINFKPFSLIKYKDVLLFFVIKYGLRSFLNFINSDKLKDEFADSKSKTNPDFSDELKSFLPNQNIFEEFSTKISAIDFKKMKQGDNLDRLYKIFYDETFTQYCSTLHSAFRKNSLVKWNTLLHIIGSNLRKSGHPYGFEKVDTEKIFTTVEFINDLIKAKRKVDIEKGENTHIVIDSLRNPIEIMFFRQRFAAFYAMAINRHDNARVKRLKEKYSDEWEDISQMLEGEYQGGKDGEFYKQNVSACIQHADIHITFRPRKEASELNLNRAKAGDNTSPYFSWDMQLLKFISLINQPGIVTPSPEERCMQLAYSARFNSGCISRQVGAAITDEFYSIKAIGWNNTPEGQVPCVLRKTEDLITGTENQEAFSPYEKSDEFKKVLIDNYGNQIEQNTDKLNGRNICFCFKSLKNSFSEGKNQVHTRALHAEESAFLQITKYGGSGIRNGKLFTTASPCELCSKKAYQLGIKVIYYIDPYSGISQKQILEAGTKPPEIRLFDGAIGSAYHWLYEPLMPYKDELSMLLGLEITDLVSKHKSTIEAQEIKIRELEAKLQIKQG